MVSRIEVNGIFMYVYFCFGIKNIKLENGRVVIYIESIIIWYFCIVRVW